MAKALSFPPRIGPDGTFVKVEQNDDRGEAEALAQHLLIRPGERELHPVFGTNDPAFTFVSQSELAGGAATFGPFVEVNTVDATQIQPGVVRVDITFT